MRDDPSILRRGPRILPAAVVAVTALAIVVAGAGCGRMGAPPETMTSDSLVAPADTTGTAAHGPVPPPPPPSTDDLIADQLSRLKKGLIGFVCPETMQVARRRRVSARIAFGADTAQVATGLGAPGAVSIDTLRVSTSMKLRLVGDSTDFDIRSLSGGEDQAVAFDRPTQWDWDVTPRRSGAHDLELRATVKVHVPGAPEQQRDETVYSRRVLVRVNPGHFLAGLLDALGKATENKLVDTVAAALVAALVGLFVRKRALRGRPKP